MKPCIFPRIEPAQYRLWLKMEVAKPEYNTFASDGLTHCNAFVRNTARQLGFDNFNAESRDQAGEMTAYMIAHPEQWEELTGTTRYAHSALYALGGSLVVAGQIEQTEKSTGHVCIVVPEPSMIASGKWGKLVSRVANVGEKNEYGIGMNYAFKTEPRIFVYTGLQIPI